MKTLRRILDRLGVALVGICLVGTLIAGCAAKATPTPAAEAPAEAAPAAAEPTAEMFAAPAAAPLPAQGPALSGTPISQPYQGISSQNAWSVEQLAVWGTPAYTKAVLSPDGETIAAAVSPGIAIFDASLKKTGWLATDDQVIDLAISPDGSRLFAGLPDGRIQVWSLAGGELLTTQPAHAVGLSALALSPDGSRLASSGIDSGGAASIKIFAANDGRQIGALVGNSNPASALAFNATGNLLASGDASGEATVWDVAAGQPLQRLGTGGGTITSLAFAPNDILAASTNTGNVITWRITADSRAEQLDAMNRSGSPATAVTFSASGNRLAASTMDGRVIVTSSNPADESFELQTGNTPLNGIVFSPDEKSLLTTGGTLEAWDLDSRKPTGGIEEIHRQPNALAFSPDNQLLAVGTQDGQIELWWTADGVLARQFGGANAPISHLAYSPDGGMLASGGADGNIHIWSPGEGSLRMDLPGHTGAITGLAFHPAANLLAASASDGIVTVNDAQSGSQVVALEGGSGASPTSVAFSPDGTLLAVTLDSGLLHLWQTADWSLAGEFPTSLPLNGAAFLPVLPLKIALSSLNGELLIWEVSSGTMQSGFIPGGVGLNTVALSPNGEIAAVSTAAGISLADLASSRSTQLPLSQDHRPVALAFSPDGRLLSSAGADGTVRIWGVAAR